MILKPAALFIKLLKLNIMMKSTEQEVVPGESVETDQSTEELEIVHGSEPSIGGTEIDPDSWAMPNNE